MIRVLFVLPIFVIGGCDIPRDPKHHGDAAATHKCTEEQIARVHSEASWCNSFTSFNSSYCYGTAIIRNCTVMEAYQ